VKFDADLFECFFNLFCILTTAKDNQKRSRKDLQYLNSNETIISLLLTKSN